MAKRFNLALNQKGFGGNHKIADVSINMGCTRGKGSTTRMFNYCNKRVNNGTCIYRFITENNK